MFSVTILQQSKNLLFSTICCEICSNEDHATTVETSMEVVLNISIHPILLYKVNLSVLRKLRVASRREGNTPFLEFPAI